MANKRLIRFVSEGLKFLPRLLLELLGGAREEDVGLGSGAEMRIEANDGVTLLHAELDIVGNGMALVEEGRVNARDARNFGHFGNGHLLVSGMS